MRSKAFLYPSMSSAKALALLHDARVSERGMEILTTCDKNFCEADNDHRIRRAMLTKIRPMLGPYQAGCQVYVYRRREGNLHGNERRWVGPGTIICGNPRHYWVDCQGSLIKAPPELLRFATKDELRACQMVSAELGSRARKLQKNGPNELYLDLTGDGPSDTIVLPESIPSADATMDGEEDAIGQNLRAGKQYDLDFVWQKAS